LNGIGIKTQSFQRIADPFIWNYLVVNDMEDKDSIGVPENNVEDKDSIGILAGPQLTPPGATVISPMMVSKSRNKKQKLNEITSIGSVPLNDIDYPLLSRALGQEDGFNPSDPTIQKYMRALLAELIDLLSTNYKLNVIDSSNNTLSFVRVPKTSSDRSFQNTKEWLDVAIKIAASNTKPPTKPLTCAAAALPAALPPLPRRRQAAADVTMSRCRHRRSHRAAATALPPSRCAPPPQRRRQAAANVAQSRCRHRR
jgi:hypothetical protein